MRFLPLIGVLLLLTACVSPLQELKRINPSADDFPSALASEYLAYADSESEQGRKLVAEHYAAKGLKALKGEPVEPEAPDTALPEANQQELAAARARLMMLLNPDMESVAPQKLARAQLLFDCWQHELARRINQETAPCADEFRSTLVELQQVADSFRYNDVAMFTLPFAKNHSRLSAFDRDMIHTIAHRAAHAKDYKIDLEGHAGLASWKQKLLTQRLAAVRGALMAAGIPDERVHALMPGSDRAVLLSCDVVKEDNNAITVTLKLHNPVKE